MFVEYHFTVGISRQRHVHLTCKPDFKTSKYPLGAAGLVSTEAGARFTHIFEVAVLRSASTGF